MALALNPITGLSHQGRRGAGERGVTCAGTQQLSPGMLLMHLMVFLGLCHLRPLAMPSWRIPGQQGPVCPNVLMAAIADFHGKAGSPGATWALDHPGRYYEEEKNACGKGLHRAHTGACARATPRLPCRQQRKVGYRRRMSSICGNPRDQRVQTLIFQMRSGGPKSELDLLQAREPRASGRNLDLPRLPCRRLLPPGVLGASFIGPDTKHTSPF